ncbi:MAG: hypothetical protein JW958_11075 [Candidatus Eisenbacteria bacterium]|nr:hypothetical protein [Candidatus Eisenbacteria bacterium]
MKEKRKRKKERDGSGAAAARFTARWNDSTWDRIAPAVYLLFTLILFGAFLFSDKMLFGTDTLPMGYAARKVFTDLARQIGGLPLWNPYLMGGIPMVDGLMGGDMFYPTTILQFLMPVHRAIGVKLVVHVFLAGWFFYLFARERKIGRPAALVGGAGYMFAPYLVSLIYAGHDGKLFVASLTPFGFLALERLLRRARFADMLLFGAAVGLMILTAHLQLAFFACGAFGFRFFWRMIGDWRAGRRERIARTAALFVVAALLGAAIGAVQTYPAYRYTSAFSPRAGGVTYEFATSWSIHWEEAVSLLVPHFGGYLDGYWGKNPFKLNCESPGFLVMLLAFAGLFRIRRDRNLLFWYLLLLVTLIYGLGAETPFFRIIYHLVPKFFRAPSTILFLFSFGAAVIAARVLDAWLRGEDRRRILAGVATGGGILLLLLLFQSAGEPFFRGWGALFHKNMPAERVAAAMRNAPTAQLQILLLLVATALFAGVVEFGRRSRWPVEAAALLLAALVFLVSGETDRDFVKTVPLEDFVREDATIRTMREDPGIFRALSNIQGLHGNLFGVFGVEAARGFFDNRIRWYDEFSDPRNLNSGNVLALLNIKYLLSAPGLRHPDFVERASEGGRVLYENREVFPRAFLVEGHEVMRDPSGMIGRIRGENFDPRRIVLLEEDPGFPSFDGGDAAGILPVRWSEYGPNRLRIGVNARRPSILFLSNAWLPYWHALVDGEEAPLLRADYAFQAVPVPSGEHEVLLYYRSGPFVAARAVTLLAVALLVLGAAAVVVADRRRRSTDVP